MVNALNDPYTKNPKLDLRLGLGLGLGSGVAAAAVQGHVTAVNQSGIK